MPVPRALQAAAEGESDPVQLKLQQAFLDQYSAPHHQVLQDSILSVLHGSSQNLTRRRLPPPPPPPLPASRRL